MLVFWVAISFAVGIGIYTYLTAKKHLVDPTLKQMSDTIDEFLDGKGGPYDWHDFVTHHSYKDPYLESIRKECASIARKYPSEEKKDWCNEHGKNELLKISERIRDEFKKTVEARKKAYAESKSKLPQGNKQPVQNKGTPGKSPFGVKGPFGKGPMGKGLMGKGLSGKGPKTAVTQMLNAPLINTAAPLPHVAPVIVPVVNAPIVNIPQPNAPAQNMPAGTAPVLNPTPAQNIPSPAPASVNPPPALNSAAGIPPPVLNLPNVNPPAGNAPVSGTAPSLNTAPVAQPSVNIPAPVTTPTAVNSPAAKPPVA
ncbi:MAG: hypothetical protein A2283_11790 [Lentisphaerae bacterium RIFOXYA12_FULL_48_11]|nr:MAG: hypothetical protein A2283_11790 [Lentisphaerae bacterium RIFOXYA12_FULL_48_11]